PRGGHKITPEVSAFAEEQLSADPALRPADLVDTIAQRFGVRVHPRSIERALTRYRDQQSKSH
ncbi:MAG TPA: helix-turn-helix domain-containing protein, partial [Mycobacterium sp.]|nr:helix-turn-helix domain-containing protein [Mycobacterium sp.]